MPTKIGKFLAIAVDEGTSKRLILGTNQLFRKAKMSLEVRAMEQRIQKNKIEKEMPRAETPWIEEKRNRLTMEMALSTPKLLRSQNVLQLQRQAGNRAVSQILGECKTLPHTGAQRKVILGPNTGEHRTEYPSGDHGMVELLKIIQSGDNAAGDNILEPKNLTKILDWFGLNSELQSLIDNTVSYEFDQADDILLWIFLRKLINELQNYIAFKKRGNRTSLGNKMHKDLGKIRKQQERFARAGNDNDGRGGLFQFGGYDYIVTKEGSHHYYIYDKREFDTKAVAKNMAKDIANRTNTNPTAKARAIAAVEADRRYKPEPIHYGALLSNKARNIFNVIIDQERTHTDEDRNLVDQFVCAFFAEPTRWSPENMYNLLALQFDNINLTEVLPMTAGSTWENSANDIGSQTPKRALIFARRLGYIEKINRLIPDARNFPHFMLLFRQEIGISTQPEDLLPSQKVHSSLN